MPASCMEDDFINLFLRLFIVYLTAFSRTRLHESVEKWLQAETLLLSEAQVGSGV